MGGMIYEGKGTNMEYEEVFDSLVKDLEEDVLSLQLTNFNDVNHTHETNGKCSMSVRDLDECTENIQVKNIEYNSQKYIFMRSINDDAQPSLIFISVDGDERGRKRGMLVTSFCGILKLIATFDYQAANNVTAKIFKVLGEYSCEEEE
ncbi:hypothetical protein KMI_03g05820 [Encephalitozoon hellem]|uniref:Profilin-like protein n=1 Tax=Encephalitozoon hellem TaxID=27973 RepID=A0A9Q9CCN9_ENCHE|nr:uncharacterized protein EHEL_061330 [Encephalitozoon hellem ATCC 50504]AFM98502.1 hypothetical protein EHEL_061330 [Encephalitozoon hellem ATCC 50504]KAG5860130.1 hypothetical protein KMI_03g05820 [Encephalitozoon hellem]UTX43428.1 prolifin-2 [Encephalitozoon hellem]WEL38892.1 profilin-like protein [Encephalitozoon hellem]|eukprot:XP_003887483.1 hypothetical protein EHEL_061330 [Encephalitozoon hellem ATCC 50504]